MRSKSRPALVTATPEIQSAPERAVGVSLAARVVGWLTPLLSRRRATPMIIGIALLLSATSLALGFTADDHFHALALGDHRGVRGVARAPWDLFAFAKNEATNRALMEEGAFPWWTDPELVVAFLRPLSSVTLWLDYRLWPGNAVLMHLHSMGWYAALLAAVALVYRSLTGSAATAALALLIFGIDDARSMPVAWIAHRNALIALTPAFLSVVAHHRFRTRGGVSYGVLAPALFALGLLGGEPALPALGYLVAYAVCAEDGSIRSRALSLAPYFMVVLAWRVAYQLLGYGALHSGVYLDPGREPLVFGLALLSRLPVLLLSQFALPISDLWEVYPIFSRFLQPLVLALAVVVLGLLGLSFAPVLRRDRTTRFWLLGAVLAAIPVCGTHPEDRVLTATALGASALIAHFICSVAEDTRLSASWLGRASAAALCVIHLGLAPLLYPARVLAVDGMERIMLRADAHLPDGVSFNEETLVMLNPPVDLLAVYWPVYRAARDLRRPAHFRWLATGESAISVTREDASSLRIRPDSGFLASSSQQMFRRPDRPIPLGGQVQLDGIRFEVTDLTEDGRPLEVLVHFDRPLEHASLRFVQWGEHAYVPFEVPREPRQMVVIPAVDMSSALLEDSRPLAAAPGAREDH